MRENIKRKPVPDCEALRYCGTAEKPDIKIFVSQRIDLDSKTVNNPLYIPVRCGAVYDTRENMTMLGDDTGDNISDKRMTFCELTVMYWAWKNVKADYYGLCHYRRYLSFADKKVSGPFLRHGALDSMSEATLEKYGFFDEESIRSRIQKTDAIVPCFYHLSDATEKPYHSIKEAWLGGHPYLRENDFEKLLELIEKHAPTYSDAAKELMDGEWFSGFNIFIAKRDLFFELCEFVFPILFEFDETLDKAHFSSISKRAAAYAGEWLCSIFFRQKQKEALYRIAERQILFFDEVKQLRPLVPIADKACTVIVLKATDTNRAMLGVLLCEILEHTDRKKQYEIIILQRSIGSDKFISSVRKEETAALQSIAAGYPNCVLRFYDPCEELGKVEIREFDQPIEEDNWYLPLLPWILPNYDKAIYLEDTVLVTHDLSLLFETDLDNAYAAGVRNPFYGAALNGYESDFREREKKKFPQFDLYQHLRTNVLVMNLKKIRGEMDKDNAISAIEEEKLPSGSISEDGFHLLYGKCVKVLPQHWNRTVPCSPEYYYWMDEYLPADCYEEDNGETWARTMCGWRNEWAYAESGSAQLFWQYARKTPFYESLLANYVHFGSPRGFGLPLPHYSKIRALADRLIPKGTKRRIFVKKIMPPKGSKGWMFLNSLYYRFGGK